jgi:hypothetical protein
MENVLHLLSTNSFAQFGPGPIIISPSLGKPALILLNEEQLRKKAAIQFELLALTESHQEPASTEHAILGKLFVRPLLGIDSKSKRAIEGEAIVLQEIQITNDDPKPMEYVNQFTEYAALPADKRNLKSMAESLHYNGDIAANFNGKTHGIRIEGTIKISDQMQKYLKHRPNLLLNLYQELLPNVAVAHPIEVNHPSNLRALPHAITLYTKPSWDEINFSHITDLHVAKRNDEILSVVLHHQKHHAVQKVADAIDTTVNFLTPAVKTIGQKLKELTHMVKGKTVELINKTDPKLAEFFHVKYAEGFDPRSEEIHTEEETTDEVQEKKFAEIPIEERFHNPNDDLRRFIRYANQEAAEGRLDFIVMTGDLTDYCLVTDHPRGLFDFDLPYTNWNRFIDIILNRPISPRDGYQMQPLEPGEELLVPIFTIVGNHDYRIGSYTLNSLGNHRLFGLRMHEGLVYKDPNKSPSALIPSKNAMRAYAQYINPFQDFFFTLGKHTFIFLDSGWDSFLQPQYLLMGDPSLTGFSQAQWEYLKLLRQFVMSPPNEGHTFLFSHAPILNPIIRQALQVGLLQKVRMIPNFNLEDFKESRIRAAGEENTRSDIDLDYHSGVITGHWADVLAWVDETKTITLNGHTHFQREFRTDHKPGFSGEFTTETPYAIYWDDYTALYDANSTDYYRLLPLHLQTPAMGFPNFKANLPPGAFRDVKLKRNRINTLAVHFLSK